jgi:hypothetical protein
MAKPGVAFTVASKLSADRRTTQMGSRREKGNNACITGNDEKLIHER